MRKLGKKIVTCLVQEIAGRRERMRKRIFAMILIAFTGSAHGAERSNGNDLERHLAARWGQFTWRVSEKQRDGSENRQCYSIPEHRGAIVYWPSRHTLSFTLSQGDRRKTQTAVFRSKPEHEVTFEWNQIGETMGLSVDHKPSKKFKSVPAKNRQPVCPF